jgi:hypothetical protein
MADVGVWLWFWGVLCVCVKFFSAIRGIGWLFLGSGNRA